MYTTKKCFFTITIKYYTHDLSTPMLAFLIRVTNKPSFTFTKKKNIFSLKNSPLHKKIHNGYRTASVDEQMTQPKSHWGQKFIAEKDFPSKKLHFFSFFFYFFCPAVISFIRLRSEPSLFKKKPLFKNTNFIAHCVIWTCIPLYCFWGELSVSHSNSFCNFHSILKNKNKLQIHTYKKLPSTALLHKYFIKMIIITK